MTDPEVGPPNLNRQPSSPLPVQKHASKSRKELPTKSKKSRPSLDVSFLSKSKGKKRDDPVHSSPQSQRPLPDLRRVSEDVHEQVYEVETPEKMQEEIDDEVPEEEFREDAPFDIELPDLPVARSSRKGKKKVIEQTDEEKKEAEEARAAKDEFLVKSKKDGLTYREIRKRGNFTEAESTLRGRFRTLTKDKEARVRKPEWRDTDVSLRARQWAAAYLANRVAYVDPSAQESGPQDVPRRGWHEY